MAKPTIEELLYAGAKAIVATYEGEEFVVETIVEVVVEDKAPKKSSAKKSAPEPEPEEVEEDAPKKKATRKVANEDPKKAYEDELADLSEAALRKRAIAEGFDEKDVKGADVQDLIDALVQDRFDLDDEEELEVEEADSAYDREELLGMTLTALKKIAKEELDATTDELKGLDKDTIADAILSGGFEEDEEEEDEEDEDEEDGDDEPYTKEELEGMSLKELKALAGEFEVIVPAGTRQATIVKKILDAQAEILED